jgi:CDGSH-type Zn-finger protein
MRGTTGRHYNAERHFSKGKEHVAKVKMNSTRGKTKFGEKKSGAKKRYELCRCGHDKKKIGHLALASWPT